MLKFSTFYPKFLIAVHNNELTIANPSEPNDLMNSNHSLQQCTLKGFDESEICDNIDYWVLK